MTPVEYLFWVSMRLHLHRYHHLVRAQKAFSRPTYWDILHYVGPDHVHNNIGGLWKKQASKAPHTRNSCQVEIRLLIASTMQRRVSDPKGSARAAAMVISGPSRECTLGVASRVQRFKYFVPYFTYAACIQAPGGRGGGG